MSGSIEKKTDVWSLESFIIKPKRPVFDKLAEVAMGHLTGSSDKGDFSYLLICTFDNKHYLGYDENTQRLTIIDCMDAKGDPEPPARAECPRCGETAFTQMQDVVLENGHLVCKNLGYRCTKCLLKGRILLDISENRWVFIPLEKTWGDWK